MTFRPANFDPSIDPTADQVRAISEEALVLLCDPNEAADDGVPPDLVW